MEYVKGTIPVERVPEFIQFLQQLGYATRPGSGHYQLGQILVDGRMQAITVNAKQVVGLPAEIAGYVPAFVAAGQAPATGITDTERLDFMLSKSRKVVVEITGWGSEGSHYAIYVEEGTMGDKSYPAVEFSQEAQFKHTTPEGVATKRQAIDLAINESKEQSSEKSN